MNIPTVDPTPPATKGGRPTVTRLQEIEIWSWYQAWKFIGTKKTKAREMGLTERTVNSVIRNLERREQTAMRRAARVARDAPF